MTNQPQIQFDEFFFKDLKHKVVRFRFFYPSEVRRLFDFYPTDRMVVARAYAALISGGKIRLTGKYRKNYNGAMEAEYESVV
jgi:hypothetical protein